MKMTYAEIQSRHKVLIAIGQLALPRKITHAISRNIVRLEKEIKIMNEQRADIADRYAKKDENGQFVTEQVGDNINYTFESDEKLEAYKDEINDLNETEVDVDIMMFKDTELDKCENERYSMLTAVQEASIEWMVDYGEEETEPAS